jgi:hypothetical protein
LLPLCGVAFALFLKPFSTPAKAQNLVYNGHYEGGGAWSVSSTVPPFPVPADVSKDRSIEVNTGIGQNLLKKMTFATFDKGAKFKIDLKSLHINLNRNTGFSFSVLLWSARGEPTAISFKDEFDQTLLTIFIDNNKVRIGELLSIEAPSGTPLIYNTTSPWNWVAGAPFTEPILIVGTVQKDARLRIDARGLSAGKWLSALVDGGWPRLLYPPRSTDVYALNPTYIEVGDSAPGNDKGSNGIASVRIYGGPLMQSGIYPFPYLLVNYLSKALESELSSFTYFRYQYAREYLPCNTGHWLTEQATRGSLDPKPEGVKICNSDQ